MTERDEQELDQHTTDLAPRATDELARDEENAEPEKPADLALPVLDFHPQSAIAQRYDAEHGAGAFEAAIALGALQARNGIIPCQEQCGAMSPPGQPRGRWICEGCSRSLRGEGRRRVLAGAWDSIPPRYATDRGLRLSSEEERLLSEPYDARRTLVFSGPAGAGKTTLACAYLLRLLRHAQNTGEHLRIAAGVRYVSAYRLARARAEHRLGGGDAPIVREAMLATTLVLDDLAAEPEARDSAVAEVIYERHCDGRRTLITTAASSRELLARYGEGIARRIWQGSLRHDLQPRQARLGAGT